LGQSTLKQLGLTEEEFLALGRVDPANKLERYGLTPLAIRMCRSTNGVSRKHGEVSRALWQKLWPEKKLEEFRSLTLPTAFMRRRGSRRCCVILFEKYVGPGLGDKASRSRMRLERSVARIPDEELWKAHVR
jgi:starch phosphorylase